MKTYESPVVVVNEDLAEGVYAASGATDCMHPTSWGYYYDGKYQATAQAQHTAQHTGTRQVFTFQFSESVTVASCTGGTVSGSSEGSVIEVVKEGAVGETGFVGQIDLHVNATPEVTFTVTVSCY